MFEPVLDPFHRTAGKLRGNADQHDIGKHRLLVAEAAAGIGRRTKAEAAARHFQRARHHRMQAERAHEIREHVIGVLARIVFGDDAAGLHRRAGIARIADGDGDRARGLCESLLRVAVAEAALAHEIGAQLFVQDRAGRIERRDRVDHGCKRFVIDLDQIEGVFREIAAFGNRDRDRLADIAHAVDRDRPAFDRRLHADHETGGMRCDVGAGQNRRDAGKLARRVSVRIAVMRACACGERRMAACSVPGRTPRSSIKRPRPVRSAASSTRSTDCPHQLAVRSDIPSASPRTSHLKTVL